MSLVRFVLAIGRTAPALRMSATSQNVWTGCGLQLGRGGISEVADMYPACLLGSRAVAMMGIRTHY